MSLEETMELIVRVVSFADSWDGQDPEASETSAPALFLCDGLLA